MTTHTHTYTHTYILMDTDKAGMRGPLTEDELKELVHFKLAVRIFLFFVCLSVYLSVCLCVYESNDCKDVRVLF